jgi:hypothetical protein
MPAPVDATSLVEIDVGNAVDVSFQAGTINFQAWQARKYMINRDAADFVCFHRHSPAQRATMQVLFRRGTWRLDF